MSASTPSSAIAACVEAGVASWPSLPIDRAAFGRHLSALGEAARQGSPIAPPSVEHAADLALAFACSLRNEAAIRVLDPILRSAVARAVAKVDPSAAFADDVAQKLRERLLLSLPPKIGTYSGRAPLRTWLRMAALRTALNMRRGKGDDVRARAALTSSCEAMAPDADLSYLRARYRGDFAAALKETIARLPSKDRTILRRYVVDRATLETLSASYGVGISTVSRWLKAIRDRISDDTQARLRETFRLTSSEYAGVAELVRSDLDISVAGLLRSSRAPE